MAGISIVAIESRKQAARRPRPPLPKPASGSCSSNSNQSTFCSLRTFFVMSSRRRFVTLLASERPMRNSIER